MNAWTRRYGPWALVTGASEGIGRDIARAAAARRLNVVLVARRASLLEDVADSIRRAHRVETFVIPADLAKPEAVDEVIARTASLDVGLLAACTEFGNSGPFVEGQVERELDMIDVNCRSVVQLTHAVSRRLVKRASGGIILMSSLVSFQGVPRAACYAATKAFVQSLAEALGIELRPHGIDVLASAPGPVMSGFGNTANMRITSGTTPEVVANETLSALGRKSVVRPGWLSKLLEASLATLPRRARVRILQQVMAGMTRHQLG
jgi:short-subunit dehydrogenase